MTLPTDAIRLCIKHYQETQWVIQYARPKADEQLQALVEALETKDARIAELEAWGDVVDEWLGCGHYEEDDNTFHEWLATHPYPNRRSHD